MITRLYGASSSCDSFLDHFADSVLRVAVDLARSFPVESVSSESGTDFIPSLSESISKVMSAREPPFIPFLQDEPSAVRVPEPVKVTFEPLFTFIAAPSKASATVVSDEVS